MMDAEMHGDRLRYVSDATTVRVRRQELLVSDGPSKHPTAWWGTIEVRPIAGDHCGGAAAG